MPVTTMPNARALMDTCPRLSGHRREPRVRCSLFGVGTDREVEGADHDPQRSDRSDARNGLQALDRRYPLRLFLRIAACQQIPIALDWLDRSHQLEQFLLDRCDRFAQRTIQC